MQQRYMTMLACWTHILGRRKDGRNYTTSNQCGVEQALSPPSVRCAID